MVYHEVYALCDICSMQVVVICHVDSVTILDFSEETNQLVVVNRDALRQSRHQRQIVHHFVD